MSDSYYVAIFGGAVAGSEAASQLTAKGIKVVVFEQNELPYGKIEYGLPKWHYKLRDRQEKIIDERLQHPLVTFIPKVALGKELDIKEISEKWGFASVLLATGAWRDRPLPVEGIDDYIGKGMYYQNGLISWFNQNHDPAYKGPQFELKDDAIIVGGGLASIDTSKMVMIELTRAALRERGIEVDALTLEHKGVIPFLTEHNLSLEKLNIKGCTLYTRHDMADMPLTSLPDNPTQAEIEKAAAVREKMLTKVLDRFGFKMAFQKQPVGKIVENGRISGMIFKDTIYQDGKIVAVDGSEHSVKTPLVISAIGSIPQQIPGLPLKGEIYDVESIENGKIKGFDNVFALGNAVTGRGNIRQSQVHSRQVSENIVDSYLAYTDEDYEAIFDAAAERADKRIDSIFSHFTEVEKLSADEVKAIDDKLKAMQEKVGYDGQYEQWIKSHLSTRLESMKAHS